MLATRSRGSCGLPDNEKATSGYMYVTLGGYNGSTNDCARVSGALPDDTNEASDKGVCEGCVVVGNSPQESPYICMAMHLWHEAQGSARYASEGL